MQPIYTKDQLCQANSYDMFPLECKKCKNIFFRTKHQILMYINPRKPDIGDFCSQKCNKLYTSEKLDRWQNVSCCNCGTEFKKYKTAIQKSKTGNHFCSKSCAAIFNNARKSTGTRTSKLEKWLQEQLTNIYPDLEFHFNRKDTILSELDIYIPSLNLAFELNGIFHYEPIYGDSKFKQIVNNDTRKFQACLEYEIELCIIDTSSQKYFKEKTSEKYLDIITNLVNHKRLSKLDRVEVL